MFRYTYFLLLIGCVKFGPVHSKHDQLIMKLEQANTDEYAQRCAPYELALAVSQKEFAEEIA